MKGDGLRPLVTLNHYTLPSWLHDAAACHQDLATCAHRGWLDPAAVGEAARYAGFVAGEFPEGDRWATLNEPFTAGGGAGALPPPGSPAPPPPGGSSWGGGERGAPARGRPQRPACDAGGRA